MNNEIKNENFWKIINSFHQKCKEEKIWYSLCGKTLLMSQREKNKEENYKNIEVMMTPESYKKFLFKFNKNVLDSLNNSNYLFSNPIYFEEDNDIIIKICLLIPAEIKRCEKMYSIKNYLRQKIGFYKTIKSVDGFANNFAKLFFTILGYLFSPITWEEISSNIYSEKFQGYFLINSLRPNINVNWIHSLTKSTITMFWNGNEINVIEEFRIYLIKNYGENWKQYEIPLKDLDYKLLKEIIK